METVTLYRPVGPAELDLIKAAGWRQFPPRLPDRPIFYPVTNQAYATQIVREEVASEALIGWQLATGMWQRRRGLTPEIPEDDPQSRLWVADARRGQDVRTAGADAEAWR